MAGSFVLFDALEMVVRTGHRVGSFVANVSGNEHANQTLTMLVTERANAIEQSVPGVFTPFPGSPCGKLYFKCQLIRSLPCSGAEQAR